MSLAAIVDYGSGNLLSVARAIEHCGGDVVITHDASVLARAERLILPGVGAFGDCMRNLRERGLYDVVLAFATSGRPFLGICAGMQMLFEESVEFGLHKGFGLISGRVEAIPTICADGGRRKVPHIGWNALIKPQSGTAWEGTLLDGVTEGEAAYFVHSYVGRPRDSAHCLAECDYLGERLCAAVKIDNMYGCQFHPEKSGELGLRLLNNFLDRL